MKKKPSKQSVSNVLVSTMTVAIMAAITSLNSYAGESITGQWDCTTETIPLTEKASMTFGLEVNSDATRFKRNGNILIKTGIDRIPELEINTFEEGTLTQVQNSLTFTPLKTDMEVIKGRELVVEDSPRIMAMLIKDETGELEIQGDDQFSITIAGDDHSQVNTCIRREE